MEPNAKKARTNGTANPSDTLRQKATEFGCDILDLKFAEEMDKLDDLRDFRQEFSYPKAGDLPPTDSSLVDINSDCLYFVGNSLGLMPKKAKEYVIEDLDKWGKVGVHGHFVGNRPWALADEDLLKLSAELVGAKESEVAVMNGLTVNLHLLITSFYKPSEKRHKILLEAKAFPSDHYAVESQIRLKGYDPKTSMVLIHPREGEHTLRHDDIMKAIDDNGDEIQMVLLPGVQYYTGQLFQMESITKAAKAKGCVVGFDLAHAVGNAVLELHDWKVDFACWCSYKYLNSGAGGLAGAFIHEDRAKDTPPALTGWWSHKFNTRFQMTNEMDASYGVSAYRISNPPIMLIGPLQASLELFGRATMPRLRAKSLLLTGYLEILVHHYYAKDKGSDPHVEIITPADPAHRGCQLSLMFSVPITDVMKELEKRGVACDERKPYVIRIAPAPLYNSFADVHRLVKTLGEALKATQASKS